MACCGSSRAAAGGASHKPAATTRPQPASDARRSGVAYFQYVGQGGIIVTGPATGNRYRFETNGAVVPVALSDRAALAGVPQLRQVAGP
jgi:hypothetical protein